MISRFSSSSRTRWPEFVLPARVESVGAKFLAVCQDLDCRLQEDAGGDVEPSSSRRRMNLCLQEIGFVATDAPQS